MVDKSEKFGWLVRVGYFSRAILYSVLGLIALTSSGIGQGTNGVFRAVEAFPAGAVVLWILVVGLAAYALFRFASTLFDIENHGSDKTGIAQRIGHAGSGIGHLALAYSAFAFATSGGTAGGGNGAQQAASGVLSVSFGSVILGALGLAFVAAAAFQAKKGISGEFMHRISPRAPDATRWLGAAGYVARAVVFAIIGWSLMQSGWFASGSQVKTLGGAVASLSNNGLWFNLVALGLILFGLFSLILARYRIIPDLDAHGKVPAFRK